MIVLGCDYLCDEWKVIFVQTVNFHNITWLLCTTLCYANPIRDQIESMDFWFVYFVCLMYVCTTFVEKRGVILHDKYYADSTWPWVRTWVVISSRSYVRYNTLIVNYPSHHNYFEHRIEVWFNIFYVSIFSKAYIRLSLSAQYLKVEFDLVIGIMRVQWPL